MIRWMLLIGISTLNLAYATPKNHNKNNEKIYVSLEDVVSTSNGFWFNSKSYPCILGASSIHTDSNGRFFLSKGGVKWICPHCWAINDDISSNICSSCGRSNLE